MDINSLRSKNIEKNAQWLKDWDERVKSPEKHPNTDNTINKRQKTFECCYCNNSSFIGQKSLSSHYSNCPSYQAKKASTRRRPSFLDEAAHTYANNFCRSTNNVKMIMIQEELMRNLGLWKQMHLGLIWLLKLIPECQCTAKMI